MTKIKTPLDYHNLTKHAFNKFARASNQMDWNSQPNPFRTFKVHYFVIYFQEYIVNTVEYPEKDSHAI